MWTSGCARYCPSTSTTGAVEAIADRLLAWLGMAPSERAEAGRALSEAARRRYGWEGVAAAVLAAAEGRLDEIRAPVSIGGRVTSARRHPKG